MLIEEKFSSVDVLIQTHRDILDYCRQQLKGDAMVAWAELAVVKLQELQAQVKDLELSLSMERNTPIERLVCNPEAFEWLQENGWIPPEGAWRVYKSVKKGAS